MRRAARDRAAAGRRAPSAPPRETGGRHFADVVIAVAPGAAVGQAHAAADAVEKPSSEPCRAATSSCTWSGRRASAARARAGRARRPRVREVHNVAVVEVGGAVQVSLHLKPRRAGARRRARRRRAGRACDPRGDPPTSLPQTHLEPLAEAARGRELELDAGSIARIVEEETGKRPQELRFLTTDQGLVAYLTLTLDPSTTPRGGAQGGERRRGANPQRSTLEIADVIVHIEP